MKNKLYIVIGAGLLGALLSTWAFYSYVSQQFEGQAVVVNQEQPLVVAARELRRGARLTSEDIETTPIVATEPPPNSFSGTAPLLGRILRDNVGKGEPVFENDLLDDPDSWLAASIPFGMRAVTVHVEEFAGVTQLIEKGDHVDVLVATHRRAPGNRQIRVRTLLENIEAIATGRELFQTGKPNRIPVITLLVEAKDAATLVLADQRASIRLVLRHPLDNGDGDTRAGNGSN